MKRGRPIGSSRYPERIRFIIRVLFLYGLSHAEIARMMKMYGVVMSKPQVSGQIASFGYRKADMPRAVRQRFLNGLKPLRLDMDGRNTPLPDYFFTARES